MSEIQLREKEMKFGIVLLKDWMINPAKGCEVRSVSGPIKLVTAKEFDFQPKGNETNWGVFVGADDAGVLILGCQIRGVYWGKETEIPGLANWNF